MNFKYVIIGNSVAAIAAVEAIRNVDARGSIAIFSKENRPAYGRPIISYYMQGGMDERALLYRNPTFYEDNSVRLFLNTTVTAIDTAAHTVTAVKSYGYEKLLIATGAVPAVFPTDGMETVNMRTFTTVDDALNLAKALKPSTRLLISGGGLIGLKCLEGSYPYTKNITVIDPADRLLSSMLERKDSAIIEKMLRAKGVKIILQDKVARYEKGACVTDKGVKIEFDEVVCAAGVRPDTSLAQQAGIAVERAIVTDDKQKTSSDDVYAAGDCALKTDFVTGEKKVLALQLNAYLQGQAAGYAMAGREYDAPACIAVNSMHLFDTEICSAGDYIGKERVYKTDDTYRRFFVKDDKLCGFIIIGDAKNAGVYTYLIRNAISLKSIDFDKIALNAALTCYDSDVRAAMLNKEIRRQL